jgi:predicted metalloendopeptidase
MIESARTLGQKRGKKVDEMSAVVARSLFVKWFRVWREQKTSARERECEMIKGAHGPPIEQGKWAELT